MRTGRLLAILLALAALAVAGPGAALSAADGPTAQVAAKKCKKKAASTAAKRKCRAKPKGPNPYVEGQPCDPAKDEAYARWGFLCLPQPQPDGTAPHLLVPALA